MNYKTFNEQVRLLSDKYADIETWIIYEIVKKYANINTEQSLEIIYYELDKIVADVWIFYWLVDELSREDISNTLDKVGKSFLYTKDFEKAYKEGKIAVDPNKVDYNIPVGDQVKQLDKDLEYIKSTTRKGIYQDVYNMSNKIKLNIEVGKDTPNEAITKEVEKLAKKGITSDEFVRHNDNGTRTIVKQGMEGVMRRLVRTTFITTANSMQEHLAEELGTNHWYVSQHMGARTTGTGFTNHAEWQGGVRTDEEMITVCGEGHPSGQGFGGYNCRHVKRPHIPGISVTPPPLLNMEELDRVYKLEQKQRLYERAIRTTKRQLNALELIDTKESYDSRERLNKRLRKQQEKLREYIKENDDVLRRDYTREKVIKP